MDPICGDEIFIQFPGCGFKYVLFSLYLGKISHFD